MTADRRKRCIISEFKAGENHHNYFRVMQSNQNLYLSGKLSVIRMVDAVITLQAVANQFAVDVSSIQNIVQTLRLFETVQKTSKMRNRLSAENKIRVAYLLKKDQCNKTNIEKLCGFSPKSVRNISNHREKWIRAEKSGRSWVRNFF